MMNAEQRENVLSVARKAIHTEALALRHMEQSIGSEFVDAVELILASSGKLIVTGMGKSGLVGRKIAATLASTGTPSFFLHPGEAFHGDLGMISRDDVILALSYSGETDEILKIVPFIHDNGNRLIAMTGNPESTLAKNADLHLDVSVKHEACILHLAPTSSTTAQIAMGDALAVALMKERGFTSIDFARLHPGGQSRPPSVDDRGQRHAQERPSRGCCRLLGQGYDPCRQPRGLGLIVICDGDDKVKGIVTDGDIRRAMESRQADFFKIKASDIATPKPRTVHPYEKLIAAEKLMTRHKVNSLLVVDDDNRLVGVIQIYDIKL